MNQLRSIDVSNCSKIGSRGIEALAKRMYNNNNNNNTLTEIDLSGCYEIVDHDVLRLIGFDDDKDNSDNNNDNNNEINIISSLKNQYSCFLSSLSLSGCEKLTDVTFASIIIGCESLVNLDVSHCYQLSDEGIKNICRPNDNMNKNTNRVLQELSIRGCFLITDIGVHLLLSLFANQLQSFDCGELTQLTLDFQNSDISHLHSLHLNHCCSLSSNTLSFISSSCPSLSVLSLSKSGTLAVTDETIQRYIVPMTMKSLTR